MPDATVRYEPHGRFWAVYEDNALVCIVVYRKGAEALLSRLTEGAPPSHEQSPSAPPQPASR